MKKLLMDDARHSCIIYQPGFLGPEETGSLYNEILSEGKFSAERIFLYNKEHVVRRESTAFGDEGILYAYAGVKRVAAQWLPSLLSLKNRLEEKLHSTFNYVLCNLYLDGQAALGWHADNESTIVPSSTIASISLGGSRNMDFRLGSGGPRVLRQLLQDGDLLAMLGDTQQYYQHQIPRCGKADPRISLTFRKMKR